MKDLDKEDKKIEALQRPPKCEGCEDCDGEKKATDDEGGFMYLCEDCWEEMKEKGE